MQPYDHSPQAVYSIRYSKVDHQTSPCADPPTHSSKIYAICALLLPPSIDLTGPSDPATMLTAAKFVWDVITDSFWRRQDYDSLGRSHPCRCSPSPPPKRCLAARDLTVDLDLKGYVSTHQSYNHGLVTFSFCPSPDIALFIDHIRLPSRGRLPS